MAAVLASVGCGDLGANPMEQGLTPSSGSGSGGSVGAAGAGGSASASCPPGVAPGSVKRILDENCTMCHGTQRLAGAPMSLATWEQLHAPAITNPSKKVYELLPGRLTDAAKPMPPQGQLSASEIDTVEAWVDAKAPQCGLVESGGGVGGSGAGGSGVGGSNGSGAGGSGVGGSGTGGSGTGGSGTGGSGPGPNVECYDLRAHNNQTPGDTSPYQVGLGPWPMSPGQFYQNFIFKTPYNKKVTALTMEPIIDNGPVLHHWLLFQVIKNHALYRDGTHATGLGTHPDSELVTGWAPGGNTIAMPPGVGMQMPEPGGLFELEIHYYNPGGTIQPDRSGVRLCVTSEPVQNVATVSWLGTENISVPARSTRTVQGTCIPRNPSRGDIHIITSVPHMHKIGTHMKTVINRAGGGSEVVVDEPFRFDEQRSYSTPRVVRPGDTLTTFCSFNNTTSATVEFGTVSEAEMCYNFVIAYPAGALHNPGNSIEGAQNTCLW